MGATNTICGNIYLCGLSNFGCNVHSCLTQVCMCVCVRCLWYNILWVLPLMSEVLEIYTNFLLYYSAFSLLPPLHLPRTQKPKQTSKNTSAKKQQQHEMNKNKLRLFIETKTIYAIHMVCPMVYAGGETRNQPQTI